MKKLTLLLLGLLFLGSNIYSKPIFSKNKYLIATLYDGATGMLSLGNNTYQLAYYPEKDIEAATDSDYWYIHKISATEYAFQNAATLKYIRHDLSAGTDRAALVFVDSLLSDKSTLFTFELQITNNICYYMIRSVANPSKAWDRRTQIQGNIYPVGVYAASGSNIQRFVFYDADGNPVIDDGKVPAVLPTANKTLGAFSGLMNSFTINGKTPAVDTSKKEFYFSVPESLMNTYQNIKLNFAFTNSAYKLYINGYQVGNNEDFRYFYGNSAVSIQIKNGTTIVASGSLIVTCLPLVQLYTDTEIGSVYGLGRISVTEPGDTPTETLLTNLKLRGDYASRVVKKAYAVKLKDIDGESSLNKSYFGLRSDNNWILDAMYIDPARMRNRVSTDLWLDFSKPTYYAANEPKMINGTRGQFVEVFLNDSYNGLYCMTEKIDRKQLNLRKLKYSADSTVVTQRGALFKASSWSIGTQLGNPITWGTNLLPAYDNNSETWTAFDVKYPDLGDGEPVEWKTCYDAAKVPHWQTPDDQFIPNIETHFDLPVFIDYYLFLDLMLASDNHGKNYYLSVYDQTISPKTSLTPWDLDGVWGRRWDGTYTRTFAAQPFETFIINNEPRQNNLYLRMMASNILGFNDSLKIRYKELRGTYFSYNSLMSRFYKYNELFKLSGSAAREKTRWALATDINTEMTFLSNWITARLAYLDKQYLGAPFTNTALENTLSAQIELAPNPVKDMLTIFNLEAGVNIQVITLQGNILQQTISHAGNNVIDMSAFKAGIYFIRINNAVSKVIKN